MKHSFMLLSVAAALPVCLCAREPTDSVPLSDDGPLELGEYVVVGHRPVIRQEADRLVYLVKNDPYAVGLDGLELLDRVPQVSVVNGLVNVAGKKSVMYIVDGHLLEMPADAVTMKLKNLQSDGIEKIELLAVAPARYRVGDNVAFISITTRNESLGTRGGAWGSGGISDDFRYSLGGNISHSTRRIELSADMGWNDTKGKNDVFRRYIFEDHTRISDRINSFRWRTFGINGLFKYKFGSRLSAGAIVNFSDNRIGSDVSDITTDCDIYQISYSLTPASPDKALTLTGFADWNIDSEGKILSLTYNRFDKHSDSFSDISTSWSDTHLSRLAKSARNRYGIHSVKLDATLPFPSFTIEAGAAYTAVGNDTDLQVSDYDDGEWSENISQSNRFIYDEHTAAVYLGAGKNFGDSFFGKLSLRYEHTDVRGIQRTDNTRHDSSYGYLFPSVNLSRNFSGAGRLSVDYSAGIIRPGFGDMNPFRYYTTVNDYFTGNPNLEPVVVHNAGVNYGIRGIYAVLYCSWSRRDIGYITRFSPDGMQWTTPENCLNTVKAGLYASYSRSVFGWWNVKVGGELFYAAGKALSADYGNTDYGGWSGKLELNTSWMLDSRKSLIFNLLCSHYFPYADKMSRYRARTLLSCELRYMLPGTRLAFAASVNDPFRWSITKSKTAFSDYILDSKTDIHSHAVTLRVSWTFGRDKVANVYRDTKERESKRSY